jgi:hypothetical protein
MKTILIVLGFFSIFCSVFGQTDTLRLSNHLKKITETSDFRHFMNPHILDQVAEFIKIELENSADSVYYQEFTVNGTVYKNVIASYGMKNTSTIVVGAHYDVCGLQDGADDNGSGTVGLLELGRQLKGKELNYRIDLVAYTLEEPPFFRTENMGSYQHAKMLDKENRIIHGMISLEMIGFFKDEKKTQDYPIGILKLVYGGRGNYITLVNKFGKGKFAKRFTKKFKKGASIRTKRFNGPKVLPGVDFSDHLNYWKFGYSALMITDTAFYRNKNYHQQTDTIETIDFKRMADVLDTVLATLLKMK